VRMTGLDDVLRELRKVESSIDLASVYEEASQTFSARLRAATPLGYSGRLRDSVVYEVGESGALVGYEEGVETSGNPDLDSVTRPRTQGRSVLKWTSTDELASVLGETFDSYAPEGVVFMESKIAERINGIS